MSVLMSKDAGEIARLNVSLNTSRPRTPEVLVGFVI